MVDAAPKSFLEVPMQLQPLKIKHSHTACQGQSQSSDGATARQTFAMCRVGLEAARASFKRRRTPPGPESPDSRPGMRPELGWGGGASGEEEGHPRPLQGELLSNESEDTARPDGVDPTAIGSGPGAGHINPQRCQLKLLSSAFAHLPAATDGVKFR